MASESAAERSSLQPFLRSLEDLRETSRLESATHFSAQFKPTHYVVKKLRGDAGWCVKRKPPKRHVPHVWASREDAVAAAKVIAIETAKEHGVYKLAQALDPLLGEMLRRLDALDENLTRVPTRDIFL